MIKQLLLGSILGAVVLFFWSALAWMLIPWPGEPIRGFANEDATLQTIKANVPRSGVYLMPIEVKRTPGMTEEQYQKVMQDAHNRMLQGPMVFASVRLEPMGSINRFFVIGFITQLVGAFFGTFLLMQTSGLSYAGRVTFLTVLGVLIFAGGHLDEWNWWGFSNAYTGMQFGSIVIGWLLAGLLISALVRGKRSISR
jgi:hypothetical protein